MDILPNCGFQKMHKCAKKSMLQWKFTNFCLVKLSNPDNSALEERLLWTTLSYL